MKLRKIVLGFDRYLLAILATVALASILPARGETAPVVSDVSQAAIALLFFLYGARLPSRAALDGLRNWRLHLTVSISTFVLFPLIGLACRLLVPWLLPHSLYFGVMFMCVLPSTVQSSIAFTSIARGNVPAAICSASLSNLAGIVLTPLLAALFLGSGVDVTPSQIGRIAAQLLLPFIVGQLTRRWVGALLESRPHGTAFVDRGSVLLVVYSAFSEGVVAGIWHQLTFGQLLTVLALDAAILGTVLSTTSWASRRLRFPTADRVVVIFCGSKKSIATGIPMAAVLFAGKDVSLIVLPAMLFHQIQLMVCTVLSRRFARTDSTEPISPYVHLPETARP